MDLKPEAKQRIEDVAVDSLDIFERVADAAKRELSATHVTGPNVLASINTMTSGSAISRMGEINQANRDSCRILVSEPSIARIVVEDEEGEQRTYYICR